MIAFLCRSDDCPAFAAVAFTLSKDAMIDDEGRETWNATWVPDQQTGGGDWTRHGVPVGNLCPKCTEPGSEL